MRKILSIIIFVLLLSTAAYADTHTAASACYDDVKSAYDAASKGDTVSVPATSASDYCYADGYSNWGTSTLAINKAIKLIGAGYTLTKIHGNYDSYLYNNGGFIFVSTGSTSVNFPLEIAGMEFHTSNGSTKANNNIYIAGAGYGWRIHHNFFNNADNEKREIFIAPSGDATCFGLIDSNIGYFLKIRQQASSVTAATNMWKMDAQFGTDAAVFVENNVFTGLNYDPVTRTAPLAGNVVDGSLGMRLVFRYNDCYNCNLESHGACGAANADRGVRSYEVYNNRIWGVFPSGYNSAGAVQNRGGSFVVTRNKFNGYFNQDNGSIKIDNRRSYLQAECGATYGFCDGNSNYDGKLENAAHGGMVDGYICLDQPGAGKWSGVWGTSSTHELDPSYFWGNVSGSACRGGVNMYKSCDSDADCPSSTCGPAMAYPNKATYKNTGGYQEYQLVRGRDFYDDGTARPDWVAYTCPHPLADPESEGSCDTSKYGSNFLGNEIIATEGGYVLTGGGADTTPPTCTFAIDSTGLIATATCSESVDAVTKTGLHFDGSVTGAITATYKDGMPGANPRFDLNKAIQQSDVVTATYATPGTGIKDLAGNVLADFTDASVFNGSTQNTPPTYSVTINKTGSGCTVTSSPSGANCGATCEVAVDGGTVVTLSGFSENGWNPITFGGDCASNGTVTVNGSKTCTATCTQIQRVPWVQ